jgi:hypothetical protein
VNATSSIVIAAIVMMVVVMMIPAVVVIVIAVRVVMMMVMMPPTVMVMVIIAVICAGSPRMSAMGSKADLVKPLSDVRFGSDSASGERIGAFVQVPSTVIRKRGVMEFCHRALQHRSRLPVSLSNEATRH